MTDFLVRLFIKDKDNVTDIKVRERYGVLSSGVGIACNILLFAVKYIIGTLSGSISVISDAFNNLSDSASCIVTMIGYKMAAKPADKDHPFGHGRVEYLTSLIIAAVIFLMGFELLKSSAERLVSPAEVTFGIASVVSLAASILLKLWMSAFNGKLGKRVNSSVMLATAQDSRNDVIATAAALIGLTASLFTTLPIDGLMGIAVSVFIIKAGFGIVRDTVDDLLGKPADKELVNEIKEIVMADKRILGIHDLVVHNYGPGKMIASCHAEASSEEKFAGIHELVDEIEHIISEKLGIMMTIHMDPVDVNNKEAMAVRDALKKFAKNIYGGLNIHDFRMLAGGGSPTFIFDVVVPYDCKAKEEDIKGEFDRFVRENYGEGARTVITFDRDYAQ
ncbi:MAG: cation diffusion facilitator family transporter [Oscillospiraceae bacterium]|nr:cation diffusion facilitator family transporter [Oscillospiraceae bacterium]MDY6207296.1 cation diffusion facilitator family transporter [Oscillospiraceae bacterium]